MTSDEIVPLCLAYVRDMRRGLDELQREIETAATPESAVRRVLHFVWTDANAKGYIEQALSRIETARIRREE